MTESPFLLTAGFPESLTTLPDGFTRALTAREMSDQIAAPYTSLESQGRIA